MIFDDDKKYENAVRMSRSGNAYCMQTSSFISLLLSDKIWKCNPPTRATQSGMSLTHFSYKREVIVPSANTNSVSNYYLSECHSARQSCHEVYNTK